MNKISAAYILILPHQIRCEALENLGYDVYTLDDKHAETLALTGKHCQANFTDAQRMIKNMRNVWPDLGNEGFSFKFVILDYFFSPAGWVDTRWSIPFFENTLTFLAEKEILSIGGSIWLPNVRHVQVMLIKFRLKIEEHYTWEMVREPSMNPLYRATDRVTDDLKLCPDNMTNETQLRPLCSDSPFYVLTRIKYKPQSAISTELPTSLLHSVVINKIDEISKKRKLDTIDIKDTVAGTVPWKKANCAIQMNVKAIQQIIKSKSLTKSLFRNANTISDLKEELIRLVGSMKAANMILAAMPAPNAVKRLRDTATKPMVKKWIFQLKSLDISSTKCSTTSIKKTTTNNNNNNNSDNNSSNNANEISSSTKGSTTSMKKTNNNANEKKKSSKPGPASTTTKATSKATAKATASATPTHQRLVTPTKRGRTHGPTSVGETTGGQRGVTAKKASNVQKGVTAVLRTPPQRKHRRTKASPSITPQRRQALVRGCKVAVSTPLYYKEISRSNHASKLSQSDSLSIKIPTHIVSAAKKTMPTTEYCPSQATSGSTSSASGSISPAILKIRRNHFASNSPTITSTESDMNTSISSSTRLTPLSLTCQLREERIVPSRYPRRSSAKYDFDIDYSDERAFLHLSLLPFESSNICDLTRAASPRSSVSHLSATTPSSTTSSDSTYEVTFKGKTSAANDSRRGKTKSTAVTHSHNQNPPKRRRFSLLI